MTNDLISRAAALELIKQGWGVTQSDLYKAIRALPAVATSQPDPRDAVIAKLVEASEALRQDMMERARCGMDVIFGEQYRIVNAGRTAWSNFCDALAAAKGEVT